MATVEGKAPEASREAVEAVRSQPLAAWSAEGARLEAAVVIPLGPGRLGNLLMVMDSLAKQTLQPRLVVLVCDGPEAEASAQLAAGTFKLPTAIVGTPKHEPGMEQPRNIGVRLLTDLRRQDERFHALEWVWFVDSDVIVRPGCLGFYAEAIAANPEKRILVGPYDWLAPGVRAPMPHIRNDPDGVPPPGRWDRFDNNEPEDVLYGDLFAGLACFGGNLVWSIDQFVEVGGFWDDLHHGRCEDGELGVRAVVSGVGISFVRNARGWHLHHERNMDWIGRANERDIPMLDDRHPYLHDEGLLVVEEDGRRLNYRCKVCGEEMNAALSWGHRREHELRP